MSYIPSGKERKERVILRNCPQCEGKPDLKPPMVEGSIATQAGSCKTCKITYESIFQLKEVNIAPMEGA